MKRQEGIKIFGSAKGQIRLNPMIAYLLIGALSIFLFAGIYFLGSYYSCAAGGGVLYMRFPIGHVCFAHDPPDCSSWIDINPYFQSNDTGSMPYIFVNETVQNESPS